MIPARDVEAELLTHPDVTDVALVGYPDGQGGELACAVVVPGKSVPTLAALREYLSARGMTRWYQPSRLELMTELPRNETGKIRRNLLRTGYGKGSGRAERPRCDVLTGDGDSLSGVTPSSGRGAEAA